MQKKLQKTSQQRNQRPEFFLQLLSSSPILLKGLLDKWVPLRRSIAAGIVGMASWLLVFGASGRMHAQVIPVDDLNQHVHPYLDNEKLVGLAIGILKDGQSQAAGYGVADKKVSTVPDGKTVFEIGSITKVFTGVLLADAVERGKVSLDTPVSTLVPSNFPQPSVTLKPINLVHLSTHSSGLPRLPDNLDLSNTTDPYGPYGSEELFTFLSKHHLMFEPGDTWAYSNLAVGLLGELLCQMEGKSYEQLLVDRIAGPLSMSDTLLNLTAEHKQRLATPYTEGGLLSTNWQFQSMAGAGSIRSTVNDMLKFAEACLSSKDRSDATNSAAESSKDTLSRALDLAWNVHREAKKPGEPAMGLGWLIAKDGATRFHNGQTGGYHSALFVSRKLNQAVVILSNTATPEVDRLAEDIFKVVAGMKVEPRSFEKSLDVSPEVMQRYVGKYQLVPGVEFTVTVSDNKLLVGLTGQPTFQVFPKSETEWAYKVVEATITFQVDAKGKCNELVLFQNGVRQTAKRVE